MFGPVQRGAASEVWTMSTQTVYTVHMGRERHPHKEIERSLKKAEGAEFHVEVVKRGHVWGKVVAPNEQVLAVWSTPRNPETMAKRVREFVRRYAGK